MSRRSARLTTTCVTGPSLFTANKKKNDLHNYHVAQAHMNTTVPLNNPSIYTIFSDNHSLAVPEEIYKLCKSDDFTNYKDVAEKYKCIMIDINCVKAVINNNSTKFFQYFLDNGLDIFWSNFKEHHPILKYIIKNGSVELLNIAVNHQRATSVLHVEHCNELVEFAALCCKIDMVTYMLDIGMTFDVHKTLELFEQCVTSSHRYTGTLRPSNNIINPYVNAYGSLADSHGIIRPLAETDEVLNDIKNKSIDALPYIVRQLVQTETSTIIKTHLFLSEMAMNTKKVEERVIPRAIYKGLDEKVVQSYTLLKIYPTDFKALMMVILNFKSYRAIIPHVHITKDLVNKEYCQFVKFISDKIDYLECLRVRPDAAHIVYDCWNCHNWNTSDNIELCKCYHSYLSGLIFSKLYKNGYSIEKTIMEDLDMEIDVKYFARCSDQCNIHRTLIVKYKLLEELMSSMQVYIYYHNEAYCDIGSREQIYKTFNIQHPVEYARIKRYVLIVKEYIDHYRDNVDFETLEYISQYIPGGLTNENISLFTFRTSKKVQQFIDETGVLTKASRTPAAK